MEIETHDDDDDLVRKVQDGDLDAFETLMRRYERLVCKVAMNSVRRRENALDVTQNVFIKVYRNIDRCRADGMFKPWLLRIAYNESISFLRKRRPQEVESQDDREPDGTLEPTQEADLLRREEQGKILAGLQALNPKYRTAVSLRYGEGLKVREIADAMGCSEGMVKSLLFRGVRQIRKYVEA